MKNLVVTSSLVIGMLVAIIVGAISVRYVFAASCTQGCGSPSGLCDGATTECLSCTHGSCDGSARTYTGNVVKGSTSGSNPITWRNVNCYTQYPCIVGTSVSDAACLAPDNEECYESALYTGNICKLCAKGGGTVFDVSTCKLETCCEE